MATYNKPLFVISASTLMGYEAHFESGNNGRDAFEDLRAKRTIICENEEGEGKILIPFHAVRRYEKSVDSEEAERVDAYCE